jgi:hypothetical protein
MLVIQQFLEDIKEIKDWRNKADTEVNEWCSDIPPTHKYDNPKLYPLEAPVISIYCFSDA